MLTADRFFSFRRLLLLVLVFLLTSAALAPASTSACSCKDGTIHLVYTTPFCCGTSREGSQRLALWQLCTSCEWGKLELGCLSSPGGCLE